MQEKIQIAVIKGDGIGVDVTDSTLATIKAATQKANCASDIHYQEILAGAAYYQETGQDIEKTAETKMASCDAIFLGAIGLPSIRYADGTEISPHLRLRDQYGLYAGVRPVKAYANAPQRLADKQASKIDMVIVRESTEGLFYSAAVHNRSKIDGDNEVQETLRITRKTTEKLHHFSFRLAQKRKNKGLQGKVTCVDKANVFNAMAFFRKIFNEIAPHYPNIEKSYNYVDAQALDLIRKPWEFDVLVMENMFGDILSDLSGGLVGGMGMAACGEIGDTMGLFQPAHGSAPDIMGQDKANPLAANLSGALMLDYVAEKHQKASLATAASLIENAIELGFQENRLRPNEFGGDMGTKAMTKEVINLIKDLK